MRKSLLGAGLLLTHCMTPNERLPEEQLPSRAKDHRQLALHWAPRFYQDTDSSSPVGDFITKFNFDGDYNGRNNWENLERFDSVPAHVYYGVSETLSHYFIHYAVFHPRDWHEWLSAEMHENDLEGVSLVIEKGSGPGRLVAMATLAHDRFYQYRAVSAVASGSKRLEGSVSLHDGSHPRVFVEAKGHGIHGCDARCDAAPGGDGIVYEAGEVAESPGGGDGDYSRIVRYSLIGFDADGAGDGDRGFWDLRHHICNDCSFGSWGRLRGDNYGTDKAKTAWAWDDPNDGEVFAGAMLCDPALFFDVHLNGSAFGAIYSHRYVSHQYYTHWFDVLAVRTRKNSDWFEGGSDLYVAVDAPDSPVGSNRVLSAAAWHKRDADVGVWYSYARGTDETLGQRGYGSEFGDHYFCRPPGSPTRFSVVDRDTGGDELLGELTLRQSADFVEGLSLGHAELSFVFEMR